MIIALNREGEITLLNKKGYNILGYKEGELYGKNWFSSCLPKEIRSEIKEYFKQLMDGETEVPETHENEIVRKDGQKRVIRWFNTLVTDDSGDITGLLSSGEDITEHKLAESALKESEEKFRSLVEKSFQGMVVALNDPVRIAYASPPMEMITGYSTMELESFGPEELTGLIHPDDREAFFRSFADRISGKDIDPLGRYRINHKGGDVRWVQLFSTLIQYNNEPATQTVFIDISEQKRAENALQDSEIRYRTYIEHSPLGIFVVDVKGKYIDVNAEACELLGYTRDELLKLSIPDISVLEEDLVHFQQLKKEGKMSYEGRLGKKDGSTVTVRLDAVSLPNEQFIAFCTDISERKKAEAEIIKLKDKLEEKVAEQTRELVKKNEHLQRFNEAMVDRELRMKELFDENEELKRKLEENSK